MTIFKTAVGRAATPTDQRNYEIIGHATRFTRGPIERGTAGVGAAA